MAMGLPLREARQYAIDVEAAGFDGLWFTEGGRTAYLGAGAAAGLGEDFTRYIMILQWTNGVTYTHRSGLILSIRRSIFNGLTLTQ